MTEWTRDIEKRLMLRISTVLNDPHLFKVYQKFGGEVFRRSSVFHGLDQFLRNCKVRGATCFEVGTWNGLTAVVLSRYFDHVVTCDIVDNQEKYEILDYLGIKNVRCVHTPTNEIKESLANSVEFDMAYLDGNHADDIRIDWNLAKHCRRVLFQEVWPFQPRVWDLVHALPPTEVVYGGEGFALWDAVDRR